MNVINQREIENTLDSISIIHKTKNKIKYNITKLETQLEQLEVEEYLLTVKLEGPKLVFTEKKLGKYRFLSRPVYIHGLNLCMYPIWINIECVYPVWSNDLLSINLVNPDDISSLETLVDGITTGLGCSYEFAKNLIIEEDITIPITLIYDCNPGSNFIINYDDAISIDINEVDKKNYYLTITTDTNMVSNIVKIKYILIVPQSYSGQIEFLDKDLLDVY